MTKIGNKKITSKISFNRRAKKRTSIGRSTASRPKYKGHEQAFKPYRGQGFP